MADKMTKVSKDNKKNEGTLLNPEDMPSGSVKNQEAKGLSFPLTRSHSEKAFTPVKRARKADFEKSTKDFKKPKTDPIEEPKNDEGKDEVETASGSAENRELSGDFIKPKTHSTEEANKGVNNVVETASGSAENQDKTGDFIKPKILSTEEPKQDEVKDVVETASGSAENQEKTEDFIKPKTLSTEEPKKAEAKEVVKTDDAQLITASGSAENQDKAVDFIKPKTHPIEEPKKDVGKDEVKPADAQPTGDLEVKSGNAEEIEAFKEPLEDGAQENSDSTREPEEYAQLNGYHGDQIEDGLEEGEDQSSSEINDPSELDEAEQEAEGECSEDVEE